MSCWDLVVVIGESGGPGTRSSQRSATEEVSSGMGGLLLLHLSLKDGLFLRCHGHWNDLFVVSLIISKFWWSLTSDAC